MHRDFHPSNICVHCDANGKLTGKLVDFGKSVVLRDTNNWVCHSDHEDYWINPVTDMVSHQRHSPRRDSKEAAITFMYKISCHRDPVGLVALVANKSDCFPEGLTLGPADDVYGLGTCVVRALTMLLDLPINGGCLTLWPHGGALLQSFPCSLKSFDVTQPGIHSSLPIYIRR